MEQSIINSLRFEKLSAPILASKAVASEAGRTSIVSLSSDGQSKGVFLMDFNNFGVTYRRCTKIVQ